MKIPQLPPQLKPAVVHLAEHVGTAQTSATGNDLGVAYKLIPGERKMLCGAARWEHFVVEASACNCDACQSSPKFVEIFAKEKGIGTETARKFLLDAGLKVHIPDEDATTEAA